MHKFKFDDKGLLTVVVQDVANQEVLMVAFMNEEALQKTLETGRVYFFSRSRNKLWCKGETSGHYQVVKEMLTDCDQDALVIRVEQKGGACHLGYRTCFVHQIGQKGEIVKVTQEKVFDPDKVYRE